MSPWWRRAHDEGETPEQTLARLNAAADQRRAARTASPPPSSSAPSAGAGLEGPWLDEVVGPDGVRVTFRVDPAVAWWQQAVSASVNRFSLRNPSFARWANRVDPATPTPGGWVLTAVADDGRKVRLTTTTRQQAVTVGHELAGLVRRHGAAALDRWR
jgi:hypothetical protein